MRGWIFVLVSTLIANFSVGQYNNLRNSNWIFGNNNGLSFSAGVTSVINSSMTSPEAATAISDISGNLLFYTDGTTVWNRQHRVMLNGDSLTGLTYTRAGVLTHKVTTSTLQGAVIVPWPRNPDLYIVFSLVQSEVEYYKGHLYYSVIDMTLDEGRGGVNAMKGVFLDSMLLEAMTTVRGDSNNVWLVTHASNASVFKAFEVTCNGVGHAPVLSNTGNAFVPSETYIGSLSVAPDRRKIAFSCFVDYRGSFGLELFDFDPVTGNVSNSLPFAPWPDSNDVPRYWRSAFSPNSLKLYAIVSYDANISYTDIFQYDLSVPHKDSILRSGVRIGITNGFSSMRLGPDGKLYFSNGTLNTSPSGMSIIHRPDAEGALCNYEADAFSLNPVNGNIRPFFNSLGTEVAEAFLTGIAEDTLGFGHSVRAPCFANNLKIGMPYIPGGSYQWSNGEQSDSITVTSTGLYVVSYHNLCSYYRDTFLVTFASGPLPGLYNTEGRSCHYSNSDIAYIIPDKQDTTKYTYHWYDEKDSLLRIVQHKTGGDTLAELGLGNYSLKIATMQGCDTTLHFTIKPYLPYRSGFDVDSFLCQNQSYSFRNNSTGQLHTWNWDFGDGQVSGMQHPTHVYMTPGTYRVRLIGANGVPCFDTVYRDIIVDTFPDLSFTMDRHELCVGENTIMYPSYPPGMVAAVWTINETTFERQVFPRVYTWDEPGRYGVRLEASFRSCPDTSFSDTLIVHAMPHIDMGPDAFICWQGAALKLQNLNGPYAEYNYTWNTGATSESIVVTRPGIYILTLSTPYGCTATGSIEIKKDCYIHIPNAFSPNGDGVNDYFFPRQLLLSGKISTFRLQVLNRWGQSVFVTGDPAGRGWDGKLNAKEQPAGIYLYQVEVTWESGRQEKYQGNVTLLR